MRKGGSLFLCLMSQVCGQSQTWYTGYTGYMHSYIQISFLATPCRQAYQIETFEPLSICSSIQKQRIGPSSFGQQARSFTHHSSTIPPPSCPGWFGRIHVWCCCRPCLGFVPFCCVGQRLRALARKDSDTEYRTYPSAITS